MFGSSHITSKIAGNTKPARAPITFHNDISTFSAATEIGKKEPISNAIEGSTSGNKTKISTIRNTRLDTIPLETFRKILEFCDAISLIRLSEANYYFYFQVIQFFNSEVRLSLSRIPKEYLNLSYIEYISKNLKESTDKEYFIREIFKNQKRKNIIMHNLKNGYYSYAKNEGFSLSTIIKGANPLINKLFKPGPIFNPQGDSSILIVILEKDIFKENFIRNMIFSRPLLRRGNLAEATDLFLNKNSKNITIQDLKIIGLLHSTEMLASVWTISSENETIEEKNPISTTILHPEYTFFIRKYFFTICTQIQDHNFKAFFKIPPQYIKRGISACANYNINESHRLILNNMLESNLLYDVSIYNEISSTYRNPLHDTFHPQLFKLLLNNHFNIDRLDKYGLTPLNKALLLKDILAAEFFINHGATINSHSRYSIDLLIMILEKENNSAQKLKYTKFEIIKLLVENATNTDQDPSRLSYFLAYVSKNARLKSNMQYCDLAQFLMENGANLEIALEHDANKTALLFAAIKMHDLNKVQYLYEKNTDLNENIHLLLSHFDVAEEEKCYEIMDFLAKNGAFSSVHLRSSHLPISLINTIEFWQLFNLHLYPKIHLTIFETACIAYEPLLNVASICLLAGIIFYYYVIYPTISPRINSGQKPWEAY